MAEKIKQSDISEKDIYGLIKKSAADTLQVVDKLNEELKESAKISNKIVSKSSRLKDAQEIREVQKQIKLSNIAMKQAAKLDNEKVKIQTQKLKAERLQTAEVKRGEEAQRKQTEATKRQNSEYTKLVKKTRDLKNESKRLAAEMLLLENSGKKNTAQYRELSQQYKKTTRSALGLDKTLKNIDARVGDNFRSVGNYSKALGGLRKGLGQLGLAFGFSQAIRHTSTVLQEFSEGSADMQKVIVGTAEDIARINEELLKIDTRTSITELQGLAVAAGKLNIPKEEIVDFVKSIDMAFVALGDDLDGTATEIGTTLGKIASTFGDEEKFGIGNAIERVGSTINELAAKSKAGAANIVEFTKRMAGVSSVAGIASADIAALGALFDESGQSIEVSSTVLNKLLPKLSSDFERFAGVAGMTNEEFKKLVANNPVEALKAVAVGSQSSEKGLNGLVETLESFGIENARAASIVGILSTKRERLTELQLVANKAYEDNTSLAAENALKQGTLSASVEKLTNAFNKQILAADGATGASKGIATALSFLAQNLGTILTVLKEVVFMFAAYRVVLLSLKIREKISDMLEYSRSIKKTGEATEEAKNKTAGLREGLKNIGFAAAIALAWEFGKALLSVANGARQAEEDLARVETQQRKSSARVEARISERQKQLRQALDLAKTEEEKIELQKKATELINADIAAIQKRRAVSKKEGAAFIQLEKDRVAAMGKTGRELEKFQQGFNEIIGGSIGLSAPTRIEDEIAQRTADIIAQDKAIQRYRDELSDLNHEVKVSTKDLNDNTPALDNNNKSLKAANTELDRKKASLKEIEDFEKGAAERLDRELELGEAVDDANKDARLSQMSEEEREIQAVKDSFRRRLDLADEFGHGREELEEQMLNEINDIRTKFVKREEEAAKALAAQLAKEKAERLKLEEAAEEKARLKRLETAKQVQQLITDFFIKNSEKRIEQIDKEISAAEKQKGVLEELAKNGNITAQQSLKEQQRIINDANKKKLAEQKRIERIKLSETVFDVYASKIEAKDENPLVSTISDVALLRAFIDSLPSFDVGADRLGASGQSVDAKGGFLAINHPDEQILTAEQNKRSNYMGAEDKTQLTEAYLSGSLVSRSADGLTAGYNVDLKPLVKEMQDVKAAINNIETSSVDVQGLTRSWVSIVEKIKKGNKVTNNVYKFRKDA
jgi:DNA repair exonuclease SbcCD ATPase subunit